MTSLTKKPKLHNKAWYYMLNVILVGVLITLLSLLIHTLNVCKYTEN